MVLFPDPYAPYPLFVNFYDWGILGEKGPFTYLTYFNAKNKSR